MAELQWAVTQEGLAALMAWVAAATGQPLPDFQLFYVPHAYLEARACDRPCPVLGWTNPQTMTVYVDDKQQDNRGLVVHELMHISQAKSGKFDLSNCEDSIRAEREAYALQARYEVEQGNAPDLRPRKLSCRKVQ